MFKLFSYYLTGRKADTPAKEESYHVGMSVYSELALLSYVDDVCSDFSSSGWKFNLLSRKHSNRIWFWEVKHTGNEDSVFSHADLVIVMRGALTTKDWVNEHWHLVAGMFGQHSDFENMIVKEYLNVIIDFVGATPTLHNNKVIFCGHSLGASVAEAIHGKATFSRDTLPLNMESIGSVSFDSPGQPENYRQDVQNGMTEPLLTSYTVNAGVNIVSSLNVPIASNFYSGGRGSYLNKRDAYMGVLLILVILLILVKNTHVEASFIGMTYIFIVPQFSPMQELYFRATMLYSICISVYGFSIPKEQRVSMIKISSCIRRNAIRAERPARWPVFIMWFIKLIYQFVVTFWATMFKKVCEMAEAQSDQEGVYKYTAHHSEDERPEAPSSLDALHVNTCYKISTDVKATALFKKADPEKHLVIPFFGFVKQGKTTTLLKLFCPKQAHDLANSFFCANSTLPLIMFWKEVEGVRVYIVDMPELGVGDGVRSSFFGGKLNGDYHTLMTSFYHLVSQAVLVQRNERDSFHTLQRSLKKLGEHHIRVVVAYNTDRSNDNRTFFYLQQSHEYYAEELTKLHVAYDFVPYCAQVDDAVLYVRNNNVGFYKPGVSIDDLRKRLDLVIHTHHLKVLRDRKYRYSWLSVFSWEGAAALFLTLVVALPFMLLLFLSLTSINKDEKSSTFEADKQLQKSSSYPTKDNKTKEEIQTQNGPGGLLNAEQVDLAFSWFFTILQIRGIPIEECILPESASVYNLVNDKNYLSDRDALYAELKDKVKGDAFGVLFADANGEMFRIECLVDNSFHCIGGRRFYRHINLGNHGLASAVAATGFIARNMHRRIPKTKRQTIIQNITINRNTYQGDHNVNTSKVVKKPQHTRNDDIRNSSQNTSHPNQNTEFSSQGPNQNQQSSNHHLKASYKLIFGGLSFTVVVDPEKTVSYIGKLMSNFGKEARDSTKEEGEESEGEGGGEEEVVDMESYY